MKKSKNEEIGSKLIKLYQARVIQLSDVQNTREFLKKDMGLKLTYNQVWTLLLERVKKAIMRDIEKHIELRVQENQDGSICAEATLWIANKEASDGQV